ncbi:MAG: cysteine synthase family protein [Anaerolineales bacterium]|nr:cysteine synthase family protein [Anaerolineales bacterium]
MQDSIPYFKRISLNEGMPSLVGNTPLLPLVTLSDHSTSNVQVFAKAEWFNPSGSVKDRPAWGIIQNALHQGLILPGMHLLDSTSGNMGIAYATFGSALGIPITLALPSNASPERIKIMTALGAELILTDPLEGSDGAIRIAQQLAADYPEKYYYANQYDNPANWKAHYRSTGPELIEQTAGKITHFVAGMGTTGTLTGVSRYFADHYPDVEIIGVQPDSPFHGLEGLKHLPSAIQPGIYDPGAADRIVPVKTEDAYDMVRCLAREEGYFIGISSGAAAVAAREVAGELDDGIVVTIFPDAGFKYLSDDKLWEGV